ncbi:location of vulva defective 1-like [Ptychodera flava]|uniref:location of vulva defective 1-like n=1 Tax=Ptychodera flava TaxID=63121 RepID=UPI00396A716E
MKSEAQDVSVASTLITNADKVTYMVGGSAQTITITLGLTGDGTDDGSVTKMEVYFTDNVKFEDRDTAKTSSPVAKDFTPPITVPSAASDKKDLIEDETVELTIDSAKCGEYSHVCVVLTATNDPDTDDNDGCLPFGNSVGTEAGTKQCTVPGIKDNSFTATAPETYTIDTTTAVAFTFSIGLSNADTANSIICTAINIHLSDDESLTKKSTAVPAAGKTFPLTIAASADGNTATTGLTASIKADAAQCSSYKYMCAQVIPGNAIDCFSISDKIKCPDSTPAPGVLADSFTITSPSSYTFGTAKAVDITFSIGLTNTHTAAVECTAINTYLMKDTSETTKSSSFPVAGATFPISVAAGADGSTATTGLTASIKADEAQCSSYDRLCAELTPGGAKGCRDVSKNINCEGDSGAGFVSSNTLLTTILAFAVMLAVRP